MLKTMTSSMSWFGDCFPDAVLIQYFHVVQHQLNISEISLLCVTTMSKFVFSAFLMKSLSCSPLEEHKKREKMLEKLELMEKKNPDK